MAKKNVISKIEHLTTAVFDTGRRGNPKPGCDCVQCFGYCRIDRESAQRVMLLNGGKPWEINEIYKREYGGVSLNRGQKRDELL